MVLFAALLAQSCDIHELPIGGSEVSVVLHLKYNTELPDYKIIEWPFTKLEGTEKVRYEVRVYEGTAKEHSADPVKTVSFIEFHGATLDKDIPVNLRSNQYYVQVWSDYLVDDQPFYDFTSFYEIKMTGIYQGNCWSRDAFCGTCEFDISDMIESGSRFDTTVEMGRPLAMYHFIATDKDAFLAYWAKEYAVRHGLPVKSEFTDETLVDFQVRVIYPQYLPNTINLFTNRPADAITGVSWWSSLTLRDDGDVDICFDWVMIGPDEGAVVVSLEFYDGEGEYVATVHSIEIPLFRSHITTVKGPLLTSGVNSGIAIDPSFDGEFNVYF